MDPRMELWNFVITRLIPGFAVGALVYFIYYYIFIKPRMDRIKKQDTLVKSIVMGDQVVTVGGIIGMVREIESSESEESDDVVILEVSENVNIRVMRPAIGQRVAASGHESGLDTWIENEDKESDDSYYDRAEDDRRL